VSKREVYVTIGLYLPEENVYMINQIDDILVIKLKDYLLVKCSNNTCLCQLSSKV
jgi:hypothetical protein